VVWFPLALVDSYESAFEGLLEDRGLDLRRKDGREIVAVQVGVVTANLQDFRNESSSWPAFELDDDVERVPDVCLDSAIRQFNTALQNAARES
jgi:hypothetical protein